LTPINTASPAPVAVERPSSATHALVAVAGLAAFVAALTILRLVRPFDGDEVRCALLVIAFSAGAIFVVDLVWQKVHLRPTTGIDLRHRDPSWARSLIKGLGLLGSLGFVALLYWLFPEYHGTFYGRYYAMLRIVLPPWLLLALPYIYFVDRHMPNPRDGYWQMGRLLSGQWTDVDGRMLGQHLLGWLIKGFFLPLMFTYMCNDLGKFLAHDFSKPTSFQVWFDFFYDTCYFIDVGLVSMGYLMSLRLTDTHLRSAEPTMLGWAVALVCYEPFWSLFGRQYLAYDSGFSWGAWLWNSPLLYMVWGSLILALTGIYVWATIMFGARFSNLTHRGIITNGPYRWTKHPAYLAKNLSWWLISVPFLVNGSPAETARHCLMLLLLNGIYALRAKTEEAHLSRDPDYVRYVRWMAQNGMFRRLRLRSAAPADLR
jgi:protein-S-isoprenylcysteine O-methyltransferase Ste14